MGIMWKAPLPSNASCVRIRVRVEQAKPAKYQPHTQHIYVAKGLIKIHSIRTDWQPGDTFIKQVSKEDFVKFCKLIFGWYPSKMKVCEDIMVFCSQSVLVRFV
jgi:hypothetical protein